MTVKEIAVFTGKTERTIQKWVKKAGEISSSVAELSSSAGHGKIVEYNIPQLEAILISGSMSKDAVSILMVNARREQVKLIQVESVLSQKDLAMVATIVSQVMQSMESRVTHIEQKFEERRALLPPPEMEPRQQLVKIVNNYCSRTGCRHPEAYGDLYREFNYIYHRNVQFSANNRNTSPINYICNDLSMINELISIASKIFADDQL